jgi:hypothetical protein
MIASDPTFIGTAGRDSSAATSRVARYSSSYLAFYTYFAASFLASLVFTLLHFR